MGHGDGAIVPKLRHGDGAVVPKLGHGDGAVVPILGYGDGAVVPILGYGDTPKCTIDCRNIMFRKINCANARKCGNYIVLGKILC